jgi:hypothetical protein
MKDPVQWAIGDEATSALENEAIQDYIRKGVTWSNDATAATIYVSVGAAPQSLTVTNAPLATTYYDPAKSLFDTVRFAWSARVGGGAGTAPTPQYTINSGVGWINLVNTLGFPVLNVTGTIQTAGAVARASVTGMTDIALGAIVGAEWLGLRFDANGATSPIGVDGGAYVNTFGFAILFDSTAGFDPF